MSDIAAVWRLDGAPLDRTTLDRVTDRLAPGAADARLDNRAELIPVLGRAHGAADGLGDWALILRAWERWGEDCPARLLGACGPGAGPLGDPGLRRRRHRPRGHPGPGRSVSTDKACLHWRDVGAVLLLDGREITLDGPAD